ncbi:MAG TPA: hypothetical protein PLE30_10950 [Candidatus Kapabacteria bacterium]|nr:hypothetical protein [Candidatus Kapabacteria bacterium]
MMIKNKLYLLFLFSSMVILMNNCGKLGTLQTYEFNTSKELLDSSLVQLINNNKNFQLENKWKYYVKDSLIHLNFLNPKYYYFETGPKEVIMIGILPTDNHLSQQCTLSIDATIRYNGKDKKFNFYAEGSLSDKETRKLINRVENSILNKLGYKYKKVR